MSVIGEKFFVKSNHYLADEENVKAEHEPMLSSDEYSVLTQKLNSNPAPLKFVTSLLTCKGVMRNVHTNLAVENAIVTSYF